MYGILISLGILLCVIYVEKILKSDLVWMAGFWSILFGIVGARAYHVIHYLEFYLADPIKIVQLTNGGLGIIGGFLFGFMALFIYLKIKGEDVLRWLDVIVIPLPLAQALGRIGNLFNNELVEYAIGEIIFCLILFLTNYKISKSGKLKKGSVFAVYLIGYSIIRVFLEFTRQSYWQIYGVSVAQAFSAVIMIVSICLISYLNYSK